MVPERILGCMLLLFLSFSSCLYCFTSIRLSDWLIDEDYLVAGDQDQRKESLKMPSSTAVSSQFSGFGFG